MTVQNLYRWMLVWRIARAYLLFGAFVYGVYWVTTL